MSKWRWINKEVLLILHDESLSLHGGTSGIRDEGLLDSALNRAVNLALYAEPDYAELAAALAIGLAKNHPFVDGNKRAAFLAIGLFLALNGYRLKTTQANAAQTMLAVASGKMVEADLAIWIRENSAIKI